MLKFKCCIELKEGYKETGFITDNTDVSFVVEAKNRVTADRMISALLKGCTNIDEYIVFGIED